MIGPIKHVLVALAVYVGLLAGLSLHRVEEGQVVLLKKFGRLSEKLYPPGFHLFIPFIHEPIKVSITVGTDTITDVPCGTSSGMLLMFKNIEVVSRLHRHLAYETLRNYSTNYEKFWLHDKIHHEVNQFCTRYSLQEIFIQRFGELDELLQKALERDLREWAPGLEIIAVRVTKPQIGKAIAKAYRKVERTKAHYQVVSERQKVKL